MAKEKVLFWLGEGVKTIDGKDYGAEMPLPVGKIDEADLKKMIKDGRVGTKIEPVNAECKGCAKLKIQVAELESEVERLKSAKKTRKSGDKK